MSQAKPPKEAKWIYVVAYQPRGMEKKQKEFDKREDAEELITFLKRKGTPYTFARSRATSLWEQLFEANIVWFGRRIPVELALYMIGAAAMGATFLCLRAGN